MKRQNETVARPALAPPAGRDVTSDPACSLPALLTQQLPQIQNYVRRYLHRTLRDQESASDLVNSVCGDLLAEGIDFEYRGAAEFRKWLRVAVLNKIKGRLRFVRAKKRGQDQARSADESQLAEAPTGIASPSQNAILREDLGLLDRALAQLPEHYRDIIVRIHLRGQSRAEVALSLGRTQPSVGNLLTRALVKLAGEMDRLQNGCRRAKRG